MKNTVILWQLEHAMQEINEIPNVNSGGCAVVASLTALALHELGVPAWCRSASWAAMTGKGARRIVVPEDPTNVYEWQNCDVYFGHVIVEIEHRRSLLHVDSTGIFPADDRTQVFGLPLYQGRIPADYIRALASSTNSWNTQFKRRNIPRIRRAIRSHLGVDVKL